ncbi:MAG: nuclear transport factor 2 family protein [Cyanobacteria bacterium P01_F01_bin.153]
MPQFLRDRRFIHRFSAPLLLGLGTVIGLPALAQMPAPASSGVLMARSPDTAPAELTNWLSELDTAASSQDLEAVVGYYAPSFRSGDGVTREMLGRSLFELWETFPGLTYQTTLQSWERAGGGFVVETVTRVISSGDASDALQPRLNATVTTRQTIRDGVIVDTTVLGEETEIKRGDSPPTVWVRLPETVRPGDEFNFDAIVQEPLSDDLLAGAAIDEPVTAQGYRAPGNWQLETLSAGGLFKTGTAPNEEGPRWISAVLVSGNGTTIVTRRLQVER